MKTNIPNLCYICFSFMIAGCAHSNSGNNIGKAIVKFQDKEILKVELFKNKILVGNRGLEFKDGIAFGMLRGKPWRLRIDKNIMKGRIEGHQAKFRIETTPKLRRIKGNIKNLEVDIKCSRQEVRIDFFDTHIAMIVNDKPESKYNYVAKIHNLEKVRSDNNYSIFLLALAYEVFIHDQNRRNRFRPGWENAPLDFFQKGGWKN